MLDQVGVALDDLPEDLRGAPPVEQHVVRRPHQHDPVVGDPQGGHAQQRRGVEGERPGAVLGEQVPHGLVAVALGQVPPVADVGVEPDRAAHHLHRLGDVLPDHGRAQHRGPVDDGLERGHQGGRVGDPVEDEADLVDVGAAVRVDEAVEDHAGLQRGQRVDVLDRIVEDRPAATAHQSVHLGLGEPGEREVRRGAATGTRCGAVLGDLAQSGQHRVGEPAHGRLVVQRGRVLPGEHELVGLDQPDDLQHEVALRRRVDLGSGLVATAEQTSGVIGVEAAVVVEPDLRQRPTGERAVRGEVAQRLVAQPVVRDRAQPLLDRLEHRAPVGARHVQRDRELRGEPADGAGQVGAVDDVLAAVALQGDHGRVIARPPGQDPAEGAEQHVVDPGAVALGDRAQHRVGRGGIEPHGDRGGAPRGVAAGPVDRQRGGVGHRGPVLERGVEAATGDEVTEPVGPVGVGGADRGQLDGALVAQPGVGGDQVVEQDPPGDAVHHEVVDGEEQPAVVEQQGAQQRPVGEVDLGAGGLDAAAAGEGDLDVGGFLPPLAVDLAEPAAQRGVVGDDGPQRAFQRAEVGVLGEVEQHGHREMVPRAVGVEEPPLDRCQRRGPLGRGPLGRRGLRGDDQREFGDRLVDEHIARGQPQTGLAGPGDDLDAEDRVAAEGEEVVGDPDPFRAKGIGPQLGQQLFGLRARGDELGLGGGAELRRGQRLLVELAVAGHGKPVELDERGGHHVIGQGLLEPRTQFGGLDAVGNEVGDEPAVAAVLAGDHGGLPDAGAGQQRGLDLARLDAEAADLHLVVGAAQVLDGALGGPPGQVAGAVHAGTRRAERVGEEPVGRQAGAVQVAARELRACDVQLPRDADGQRPQVGVEDVSLEVAQRATDRRPIPVDHSGQCVDGRLGGAVEVVHGGVRQCGQLAPQVVAEGLAAEHQHGGPVLGVREEPGGQQLAQVRRGEVEEVDPVRDHVVDQRVGVQAHVVAEQVQLVAARHQDRALQRGVEGEHGRQGDPHPVAAREVGQVAAQQVHQGPVLDGDALGFAGGTGGVDDVRGVVRPQPCVGVVIGVGQRQVPVEDQDRAGVLDQVGAALSGQRRVDRQVDRARLEHRELRDHGGDRARQRDGDHLFPTDALADQVVRDSVRAGVQLGVGQRLAREHQRGGVRGAAGLLLEDRREGGRLDGQGRVVPPLRDGAQLGAGQPGQLGHRAVGGGRDRVEQGQQVPGEAVDGLGVEQVGAVLQHAVQLAGAAELAELDAEVEVRRPPAQVDLLHGEAGELREALRRVLQHHQDVEQRVAARVARRADGLDQPVERHLVVAERVEGGAVDHAQELDERGPLVHSGAEHHGVDEEPDDPAQLGPAAPGGDGAERDVVDTAVAGDEQLAGRHEGGEQRGVVGAGQVGEPSGERGGHRDVARRARRGPNRRARAVGGQVDRLGPGQRLAPVLQVLVHRRAGEPALLPDGEVGVVQGRGGQVAPGVELGQFLGEHAERPTVDGDVVHGQQQDVFVVAQPEQHGAQQRPLAQVERLGELGLQGVRERFRGAVEDRDRDVDRVVDDLHRAAVDLAERAAQRFVPRRKRLHARDQGRGVEVTGEAQGGAGVVVVAARVELAEEPQALLRRGQR
ncbi:hypothetical protein GCM10010483_07520 [Actinokineospora diospyrosa]